MAINEAVLIDTGPFIAYMNQADTEHEACVEIFKALPLGRLLPAGLCLRRPPI